jgi:hypothetical protein
MFKINFSTLLNQGYAVMLMLLSMNLGGQELNCCDSQEAVKSSLEGTWTLKNVNHSSLFEYIFASDQDLCFIIQDFTEKDEDPKVVVHQTTLRVIDDESGFALRWDTPLFYWDARIVRLKSKKMTLNINGSNLVFKRTKEPSYYKDKNVN